MPWVCRGYAVGMRMNGASCERIVRPANALCILQTNCASCERIVRPANELCGITYASVTMVYGSLTIPILVCCEVIRND